MADTKLMKKPITFILVCLLFLISYILNFGWLRFFLAIPVAFYSIFLVISSIKNIDNKTSDFLFYTGLFTFLASNIMLLDFDDSSGSYIFFHLIHIDDTSFWTEISLITATVNLVISILCTLLTLYKTTLPSISRKS
jgi:hypothetical protein